TGDVNAAGGGTVVSDTAPVFTMITATQYKFSVHVPATAFAALPDAVPQPFHLQLGRPAQGDMENVYNFTLEVEQTPTVTGAPGTSAKPKVSSGEQVQIAVNFTHDVTVTTPAGQSAPSLVLGTTPTENATYVSTAGGTLNFVYTVQPGDAA